MSRRPPKSKMQFDGFVIKWVSSWEKGPNHPPYLRRIFRNPLDGEHWELYCRCPIKTWDFSIINHPYDVDYEPKDFVDLGKGLNRGTPVNIVHTAAAELLREFVRVNIHLCRKYGKLDKVLGTIPKLSSAVKWDYKDVGKRKES